MAETDEKKEKKELKDQETKRTFVSRFLPWIIMTVVVLLCAGAGLGLGRLIAGSRIPEKAPVDFPRDETLQLKAGDLTAKDAGKVWYYDLDPVVANLNEPGISRYVRATFTLEISPEIDPKKGTAFLDEKKPVLINWLTVYLSSLALEDIRGDKNLRSIQSHVCEAFNDSLFPNSKPQIKHVLIKEFPVQ